MPKNKIPEFVPSPLKPLLSLVKSVTHSFPQSLTINYRSPSMHTCIGLWLKKTNFLPFWNKNQNGAQKLKWC